MIPNRLKKHDRIHIISPSGAIDLKYIDGAKLLLKSWGLKVTIGNFATSNYGRFAGTMGQRTKDLQEAINDTSIKAILCSRGGYGLSQIIDKINFTTLSTNPKWIIGFSDITVLHNVLSNLDIASLHCIMAKHLTELPESAEQIKLFKNILFGILPEYNIQPNEFNRNGVASGKLIGGNLSVLYGLRGTPFDLETGNNILFIEDVAENPYHIDRMLQNLRHGGFLSKLSGLIIGQFSDCDEDPTMMQTISEIIASSVNEYNFPVCFGFPAGHVDYNLPLILGAEVNLNVSSESVKLNYTTTIEE